jgi:hypothetical protein
VSRIHEAAIEAKAAGNEAEHKQKLTYAEQLLNELVAHIESLIETGSQALNAEK